MQFSRNRWQRESHVTQAYTHRIKIGFIKRLNENQRKIPGKLPGFLICFNREGQREKSGAMNWLVDYDAMAALGISKEKIALALDKEVDAPDGTLPTQIEFVITTHAVRELGRWQFPGLFDCRFSAYKDGDFCHGDGLRASRRQDDGSRKEIECKPVGCAGCDPSEWCPYSSGEGAPKLCQAKAALTACLIVKDENARGGYKGLCTGGEYARAYFSTTSEPVALQMAEALNLAAERLDGYISDIRGALTWSIGVVQHAKGRGKAPRVKLTLSEGDMRRKEADRRQYCLAISQNAQLALPGPDEDLDAEEPPVEDEYSPVAAEVEPEAPTPEKTPETTVEAEFEPFPEPEPAPPAEVPVEDDLPWDYPEEQQATQGRLQIGWEQATDEELAMALSGYFAGNWKGNVVVELTVMRGSETGKKKKFEVPDANWFLAFPNEDRRGVQRRESLVALCKKLSNDPEHKGFKVWRDK